MEKPGTAICDPVRHGRRSDRLFVVRGKPKLLDRLHQALHSRHYSSRTEHTYCPWVKRFLCFHDLCYGKGAKDRIRMLPKSLKSRLRHHLKKVKAIHERDLAEGER